LVDVSERFLQGYCHVFACLTPITCQKNLMFKKRNIAITTTP